MRSKATSILYSSAATILAAVLCAPIVSFTTWAQTPAPNTVNPAPTGPRAGIPRATQEQAIALVQMDAGLEAFRQNVTIARNALAMAVFLDPPNDQAVQAQAANLRAAELALAKARAAAFAKVQSSPAKLAPDQVTAFAVMGASAAPTNRGGGRGRGGIAGLTPEQTSSLVQMMNGLQSLTHAESEASAALVTASLAGQGAAIQAAADNLGKAELALAKARAAAFVSLQGSSHPLNAAQVSALIATDGVFTAPVPFGHGTNNGPTPLEDLNFNDHTGYVSIFDGTLKDWDGNPKFWRAENGELIGESTANNPSGNQYIVYRGTEAHDFTLKLEIKLDNGGSGIQYRSQPGIPWASATALSVEANTGPVNNNWLLTGPQADFFLSGDPASRNTGQFYSENNSMRIMASRGNVVEGAGLGPKRLMGTIGNPDTLYKAVRLTAGTSTQSLLVGGPSSISSTVSSCPLWWMTIPTRSITSLAT